MTRFKPDALFVQKSETGTFLVKPVLGQVVAEIDPIPDAEQYAYLLAAAPEMLEVLKKFVSAYNQHSIRFARIQCLAEEVIAKAEGDHDR